MYNYCDASEYVDIVLFSSRPDKYVKADEVTELSVRGATRQRFLDLSVVPRNARCDTDKSVSIYYIYYLFIYCRID